VGPFQPRPKAPSVGEPPKSALERYRWPAVALVAVAVITAVLIAGRGRPKPLAGPLDGYQRDVTVVQSEYRKFHGKLLRDPQIEHDFLTAAQLVDRKDYTAAIDVLEGVAKTAAVPVIFHDLGSLYSAAGDRARAVLSFREALVRDPDYRPVRASIERLKWVGEYEADPLKREIEPNNSPLVANLIGIGSPVEGEITPGDTDTFKFVSPPAPRDIVELTITNVAQTLELGIRLADDSLKNDSANLNVPVGESVTRYVAQPPNTPLFLQLWGAHNTTGPYRLVLRAMKAFDEYEPNDDVYNAHRVEVGEKIQANIMDAGDTDFYVFQSPRTGTLTIDIANQSPTLIPALTTFNSEKRNTGFGPDIRTPGASLHHTIEAQEHQTYYVQVWSQALTFGKYTLTIQ
jgi:hypothetical protein